MVDPGVLSIMAHTLTLCTFTFHHSYSFIYASSAILFQSLGISIVAHSKQLSSFSLSDGYYNDAHVPILGFTLPHSPREVI